MDSYKFKVRIEGYGDLTVECRGRDRDDAALDVPMAVWAKLGHKVSTYRMRILED